MYVKGVAVTDEGSEDVPYNAAYHGYWASDFTKLNPTLGTTEEFETMISEAHKRGMRIMVDIVVNHAGYGTESTFADMLRDKSVSEGDIKSWQSGLPDFATEKADVRAKLVEWQTSWMKDYGVDYFRVDTVKHVDSTTWAALKNSTTEVNPSFKMIGEYYGAGYASNGSTLGTGQMDADLDFDFNDQATSFVSGNISSVESFLSSRNTALNNAYMTGQFLSSHDEDGFKASLMNGKGYTEDEATSAALVAATLQLTAKGIPVIYYGEEVGLSGLNNYPYQTNRYDMDFSLATEDNVTYQHYKNLLSIRNAYTDVFARGSRKVVASSDEEGYDVVSRSYGGTTLYVGMNIKNTAKEVKVPVNANAGNTVVNLYDGKTYTVSSDKTVTVTIPAAKDGGTVVLRADKKINLDITVPGKDFQEVIDTIDAVGDTAKINVTMPDTTKVPAEVFNGMIGKDITIEELREQGYKGFYVAIGLQSGGKLGVPGEDAEGVKAGIELMREVNLEGKKSLSGRVVVIGGGNIGADVARTALRCGAEKVSLYCLEDYDSMPMGVEDRTECEEDGIEIHAGWGQTEILAENGKCSGIRFRKCLSVRNAEGRFAPTFDDNATEEVPCDMVLYCIGQKVDWKGLLTGTAVELNPNGTAKADPVTYQTAEPDIFVGGDVYTGQKFAIDAIAAGKQGAVSLHRWVQDATLTIGRDKREFIELDKNNLLLEEASYDNTPRQRIGYNETLRKTFKDGRVAFTEEQVKAETARCLGCGASVVDPNKCIGCGICTTRCAFDAIHLHRDLPECSTMRSAEDKMKGILPYMIKRKIRIRRAKKAEKRNG